MLEGVTMRSLLTDKSAFRRLLIRKPLRFLYFQGPNRVQGYVFTVVGTLLYLSFKTP